MSRLLPALRLLIALALALVVWEVAARVDDRLAADAPLLGPYNPDILYTEDALGVRGKPHARYSKWRLNALGYRGPEIDPDPGRARVATLGASETFGLYEGEGREYPRQLESELNARAGRDAWQVVNVAYPALNGAAARRRLPGIVETLRPSYVTVYLSPATYVDRPEDLEAIPRAPEVSPRELRIAGKIKDALKAVLPQRLQTALHRLQARRETRGIEVWDRLPETNVEMYRRDLAAIVEDLRRQGVAPVLVTHATRFGDRVRPEERPLLVAWRRFFPRLAEDGFLDMERRMNAVVRETAAARGVVLVDAARRLPPGPRAFADYVHFTDEGARQMAVLVAEGIRPALVRAAAGGP
jgi:lysophospholipase L1-like esterase